MSAALEATYRRALAWYPKRWRAANEDAVIGTLLDQADDDERLTPARGELANLRMSAIGARFGWVDRAIPLGVRERAATIALALGFTIALAGIVLNVWQFRDLESRYPQLAQVGSTFSFALACYGIWFAAFVTALVGLRKISIAMIVVSIPVSIALALVANVRHLWGAPGAVTVGFLGLLAIVYLLGAPRPTRRFRVALGIGAAVLMASFALIYWAKTVGYWGNGAPGVDWFWGQFAVWLTFLGIPAVIVGAVILWRTRRSPWAPAMLLAAAPILPLALVEFSYATTWLDNIGAAVAVLVVVGLVVLLLRVFGVRVTITRA